MEATNLVVGVDLLAIGLEIRSNPFHLLVCEEISEANLQRHSLKSGHIQWNKSDLQKKKKQLQLQLQL